MFKLLMSNFCSSYFNCISFSDRVEFYRLVKSFNDSKNIRMQRHKHLLHILQNAVDLTDKFIINPKDHGHFQGRGTSQREWDLGCAHCLAERDSNPASRS